MSATNQLIESWLTLQCSMLAGAVRATVVRAGAQGAYETVAGWPTSGAVTPDLANVASSALGKQQCTVSRFDAERATGGREGDIVTCPLSRDGKPFGIVAVELPAGTDAQRNACAKALQWGGAWLELLLRAQSGTAENHLLTVVDMVATSLEHTTFQESATAVVAELARRIECERVTIGYVRRGNARIDAVSRSASADNRTALLRTIAAAMDEAIDQDATLVYPRAAAAQAQVVVAHEKLSTGYGSGSACSIPISVDGRLVGAVTLEHRETDHFDATKVALCEAVIALVGPILTGKRDAERWVGPRLLDSLRGQLAKLTGPRHARFKLGTAITIAVALFLGLATGEYRVSADATLESMVQRAVTAPFDGYVDDSSVRPGDLVKVDEILCRLEDRDLKLEEFKWSSEAAKLQKEAREAMAADEYARVRILQAQLDQAAAQLDLVREQLARTQVTAPVDGMIVKGDLTQSLGAPVERGDVLFEVAPLDDYRVMLAVDERDVGALVTGLAGQLALAGLPDKPMPIVVQRITPISTVEDGKNYFAVQAKLLSDRTQLLRPGMQGVGKIYIGRRKLAWIWTHDMLDWLRLWSWNWTG
ncbi:MAG: HlyD family efflux transporter periplasmic adaptor subunit [Gammaproteobacteria bacterium]